MPTIILRGLPADLLTRLYYRLLWCLTGRTRRLRPVTGDVLVHIDPRYLQPSDVDRLTGIAYR